MQNRPLSYRQRLTTLLLPPLVVLCLAVLLFDAIQRRRHSTELVRQTHEVIGLLDDLRTRLVDAEAGQRGFLVSGREADLSPYQGAARDVWTALAKLREQPLASAAQRGRLDSLELVVERRLERLESGIALRRTSGFASAQDLVMNGDGGALMGEVRRLLTALEAEERSVLRARNAREEEHARRVLWVLFGGSLLAIVAAVTTQRVLAEHARVLQELNGELREKNQLLEDQALELEMQTEELQAQSAQLQETLAELETANEELESQRHYLEEMAAELEASNDELLTANHALEERTHEAVEANRAKSDFLATMSHELRTPLNAIAGYTELLEMGIHGPVTEAQGNALGRIRRNQKYLLSLINDVLNFAKLEAGKIEVRVADVPVASTVAGLEDVIAPQVRAKELHYSCQPGDDSLRMRGDRERIEQILINLLTNAIKFTEPGGEVAVSCEADDEQVRIRVRDTGCGVPRHRLEEIFDPFVQVNRESSGNHQGVGLGLAISRELAQSMGGDLVAESREGEGSVFTLSLLRGRRVIPESIFSSQMVGDEGTAPVPPARDRAAGEAE